MNNELLNFGDNFFHTWKIYEYENLSYNVIWIHVYLN
jgi:hypothetical protein